MNIKSIPYIIVLGMLFGATMVASRFIVGQFEALTYVALRLVFASLGFLLFYVFKVGKRKYPRDRRLWKLGIVYGIFSTALPMSAFVTALRYQSSGVTAVLMTTGPAVTAVLAHFFLDDEELDRRRILGIILALSGAILMAILGESGIKGEKLSTPLGYLLVIGGLVSGSTMRIFARKYMIKYDFIDITYIRLTSAAVLVAPLSIILVGFDLSAVNQQGWFALGFASVAGTFLAMLLDFYNVIRFGAIASSMMIYVIPVVAGLGGVLVLGEQITVGMLAGMGLIVLGILRITTSGSKHI